MNEPTREKRTAYLVLLTQPSAGVRIETVRFLRERGLPVLAQHGNIALEALATPEEAETLSELGIFAAVLKSAMKQQHVERLSDQQRRVVELWNTRFSAGYVKGEQRAQELRGRSWDDPKLDAPGPYSAVEPEEFLEFVREYEDRTGERVATKANEKSEGPPRGAEFGRFERRLADRYEDPSVAYHLARLAARLGSPYWEYVLDLSPEFIQAWWDRFFREEDCWRMTGEQSVGIVVVESSRRDGPTFSTAERNEVCREIVDGLNFLAATHPGGDLSWVLDFQFARIDVADGEVSEENCPSSGSIEAHWRDPAMGEVSYNGNSYSANWAGVGAYREHLDHVLETTIRAIHELSE